MTFTVVAFVGFLLLPATPIPGGQASPPPCDRWEACRDLAEQARAAGDYETFHDLAWRTIQTRGRRDPELFFLLARAQSLSGRPHDALVTLRRLAQEMKVPKDVSGDEDFRRVRALPAWPEIQAVIQEMAAAKPDSPATIDPGAGAAKPEAPRTSAGEPARKATPAGRSTEPAAPPRRGSKPAGAEEVARFATRPFVAGGLAYDAASQRFVIGNMPARKLTIVERGSNRAATLSGDAARFRNVKALEIDRRHGDLWVISNGQNGSATDDGGDPVSELHKLQLVSGRVLTVYAADPSLGVCRFADVAVHPESGVLVLDAEGPRLLRPRKDGRTLALVMDLPEGSVTSLAPGGDGQHVYVAYSDRVVRADLSARRAEPVRGKGLDGLSRVRWYSGSLVGVRAEGEEQRIVRLRLAPSGTRVVSSRVLDATQAAVSSPIAADLLKNEFYYLVPEGAEASIRRIRLK